MQLPEMRGIPGSVEEGGCEMSRILLISTPFCDMPPLARTAPGGHYPMGLLSLHVSLTARGHDCEIMDLNHTGIVEAQQRLTYRLADHQHPIDYVGFQVLSNTRQSTRILAKAPTGQMPYPQRIYGGIHASLLPDQILADDPTGVVVVGDGEDAILEIAEGRVTPGTIMRPAAPSINSPAPDHHVFLRDGRKVAGLATSRGCPFCCSFCCHHPYGRMVRYRPIPTVMEELDVICDNQQVRDIWFHDDGLFVDRPRAKELLRRIAAKGYGKRFFASARIGSLDAETVELLDAAGFCQILFGLESGAPKVLELAGKRFSPGDAIRTFELFRHSRVSPLCFLIVGLAGETEQTIDETAKLVNRLKRIRYWITYEPPLAMVYPGTELERRMTAAGYMTPDYWRGPLPAPVYTAEHTIEELVGLQARLTAQIGVGSIEHWKIMGKYAARHMWGQPWRDTVAMVARIGGIG